MCVCSITAAALPSAVHHYSHAQHTPIRKFRRRTRLLMYADVISSFVIGWIKPAETIIRLQITSVFDSPLFSGTSHHFDSQMLWSHFSLFVMKANYKIIGNRKKSEKNLSIKIMTEHQDLWSLNKKWMHFQYKILILWDYNSKLRINQSSDSGSDLWDSIL